MTEKLNEETVWYLKKMMEIGEKALTEGKTYTNEEVKNLIKARYHEGHLVRASVG